MATVFISYRREETAGEARALFQVLVARLGEASVFMDVDTIALGRDFRQVLQERLASCDLLLALIGRGWIEAKNASGKRRLDDPADYVRLEIEAALKRNIPVTPVFVQDAQMPSEQQLPESLRDLVYRNGFELSHNRWESDVQEMLRRLGLSSQRNAGSIRETGAPAGNTPSARPPAGRRNSDHAVVSLILSIVSLVSLILSIVGLFLPILGLLLAPFITILGLLTPITAVITGHMAKKKIQRSNGALGGDGLANVGLVLGYIMTGIWIVIIFVTASPSLLKEIAK